MSEESDSRWQEQNQKWERNQAKLFQRLAAINARWAIEERWGVDERWGVNLEPAFHNASRDILQEVSNIQVIQVNEFDDTGVVFGQPDQVEFDIIIHNGILMICEMKSSVSKGDIALFERKIQFYEQRHQRKVTGKVVISPMVDPRALQLANTFGMRIYHNAEDVELDEDET